MSSLDKIFPEFNEIERKRALFERARKDYEELKRDEVLVAAAIAIHKYSPFENEDFENLYEMVINLIRNGEYVVVEEVECIYTVLDEYWDQAMVLWGRYLKEEIPWTYQKGIDTYRTIAKRYIIIPPALIVKAKRYDSLTQTGGWKKYILLVPKKLYTHPDDFFKRLEQKLK